MYIKALLAALLAIVVGTTFAAGPAEVAVGDRSAWPHPLSSAADFDLASRAELLAFGNALASTEQLNDRELQELLNVKTFDHNSVERIRAKYWTRLTANYMLASAHCEGNQPFCVAVHDQADFRKAAVAFNAAPQQIYRDWFTQARSFHRTYLAELLLRLAALFPRVNSEVDTYSPRELDGNALPHRSFLLTFDDGPTLQGGSTDGMLETLRASHLNGVFFTLGAQLQNRLKQAGPATVANAYSGMCVGSHGWEHRSHSTLPLWQDSVTRSVRLVRDNLPVSFVPLFRPPYGQRKPDSEEFFSSRGLHVVLWNIDSQDWNAKMSANDVKQRVLTLMLLWRHGVILFHDIHPKAQVAVPWLKKQLDAAGIQWVDCKKFISE